MKRTHVPALRKSAKIKRSPVVRWEEPKLKAKVDGNEVRSNTLDRKYGRSLLFVDSRPGPNGKKFDPLAFAKRSLVNWLNGWQPASEFLLEFDSEESRQRIVERVYGGDVAAGKRAGMDDWNEESRDRIIKLLAWVQGAPARLAEQIPGPHGALFTVGILGESMKRYAVYPGLAFYMRSNRFAVYQVPLDSEQRRYVELTVEEKAETNRRKRWNYSLGPGVQFPPMTAEEKGNPSLWHKRVEALATHRTVPPETPYGEVQAAHAICDLARFGLLYRIIKCQDPRCGRWLYAPRPDAKQYCTKEVGELDGKSEGVCKSGAHRFWRAEAKKNREAEAKAAADLAANKAKQRKRKRQSAAEVEFLRDWNEPSRT